MNKRFKDLKEKDIGSIDSLTEVRNPGYEVNFSGSQQRTGCGSNYNRSRATLPRHRLLKIERLGAPITAVLAKDRFPIHLQ